MKQFSIASLIEKEIRSLIDSGRLKPGDPVTSEQGLAKKYKVSRMTSRKSLERLAQDGLIYREPGRGSFVAKPKLTLHLGFFRSIEDQLLEQGFMPSFKLINFSREGSSVEVAQTLALKEGTNIYKLKRLKIRNHEIYGFEERYFPADIGERFTKEDLKKKTVFHLLDKDPRTKVHRMTIVTSAKGAQDNLASILKVRKEFPLIVRQNTLFAYNNRPIQYGISYFRSDRYQFSLEYKIE